MNLKVLAKRNTSEVYSTVKLLIQFPNWKNKAWMERNTIIKLKNTKLSVGSCFCLKLSLREQSRSKGVSTENAQVWDVLFVFDVAWSIKSLWCSAVSAISPQFTTARFSLDTVSSQWMFGSKCAFLHTLKCCNNFPISYPTQTISHSHDWIQHGIRKL